MHNQEGMRVKLGCVTLAKLLVLRVAGTEEGPVSPRAKACEIVVGRFRGRKRCDLLREAGLCEKRKGRTEALPEKGTPIHRCPFEG